jgi:hypothetical protein
VSTIVMFASRVNSAGRRCMHGYMTRDSFYIGVLGTRRARVKSTCPVYRVIVQVPTSPATRTTTAATIFSL